MQNVVNISDLSHIYFNSCLNFIKDNLLYQIFYSLNYCNDFSLILICFIHFNYFISTQGRIEEQIPVCFYHNSFSEFCFKPWINIFIIIIIKW